MPSDFGPVRGRLRLAALTCQGESLRQVPGRSSCGCRADLRMSPTYYTTRAKNNPLSGSKSMENSEEKRLTLPSLPEWMMSCTAYAMGWNRVHTALTASAGARSAVSGCTFPNQQRAGQRTP